MSEDKDGLADSSATNLNRLVIAALSLSLGSGAFTLVGTSDRFYGEDAAREFAIRDLRLAHIEKSDAEHKQAGQYEIRRIWQAIEEARHTHPPPKVAAALDELDKRLREMELQEARKRVN